MAVSIMPAGTQRYLLMIIRQEVEANPDRVLTNQALADIAQISERTVIRNIRPLVDCGVIVRETAGLGTGRGWGYIYRIADE